MEPSINAVVDVTMVVTSEPCWMDSIIDFLAVDQVLNNQNEANQVHKVAARYWLSIECKMY